MNPAPLHAQHRALSDMLRANAGCRCDRITRLVLDSLDDQARKFLRLIEATWRDQAQGFGRGSTIMLSIHGGEAAIADIIRMSTLHREKVHQLEAAE